MAPLEQFLGPEREPLVDALVCVEGWSWIAGFTDGEGRLTFSVSAGQPLEYALQAADGATCSGSLERSAIDLDWEEGAAERIVSATPIELEATVIDAKSRNPIAGAFVWPGSDEGRFVRTTADGRYRLREVGVRNLYIGAGAAGYQATWERIEPSQDPLIAPTIALSPTATLSGRVVDANGAGVGSAEVRATRPNYWRHPMVSAREDGSFRFGDLELGEIYEIVARAPGFASSKKSLKLTAGSMVELVLQRGRSLVGTVVDESRAPIAGAEVLLLPVTTDFRRRFRDRGKSEPFSVTSDEGGVFRVDGLADEPMALLARAPGFARRLVMGLEMEGDEPIVDAGEITLEPGVALRGVVRNRAGAAIESAQIFASVETLSRLMIEPESARELHQSAVSGPAGEFLIDGLARKEPVRLRVRHDSYVGHELEGVLPGGEEPLDIVLERAARVSGRVESEDGQPVGGASVTVKSLSGGERLSSPFGGLNRDTGFARSAEDGSFSVTGVRAGAVELAAEASGYLKAEPVQLSLEAGEEHTAALIVLRRGATLKRSGVVFEQGAPRSCRQLRQASTRAVAPIGGRTLPSAVSTGGELDTAPQSGGQCGRHGAGRSPRTPGRFGPTARVHCRGQPRGYCRSCGYRQAASRVASGQPAAGSRVRFHSVRVARLWSPNDDRWDTAWQLDRGVCL
jgi:hypothetical protein